MKVQHNHFPLVMLVCLAAFAAPASAGDAQTLAGSKISCAPFPAQIHLQPNQRPTMVVIAPCAQVDQMTHGFPPVLAMENFMLTMMDNINNFGVLPLKIEPVCG